VIHIGPHKTGTTYLQHAFTRLRPGLAARGILWPEQWGGDFGHYDLAQRLTAGEDGSLHAAFDALRRSGCDIILLSSEIFADIGDVAVARLLALLAGDPATVVFYCRRWSELIPSGWGQDVRHGSVLTLPAYAYSHLIDPWASALVNFDQVLARYAGIFGIGALRLVSYNGVMESGEDLLKHFCREFLAWNDPPPVDLGRVNDSLNMVDHEIIRALNVLEWRQAGEARQVLTMNYLAAKADLPIGFLVDQAMQFNVETLRLDDTAPGLATLHANIAARYRIAQVNPVQRAGLFEPRTVDVAYVRPDYLMVEGVLETLREMHRKLRPAHTGS
jgi:hypothetical protein